MVLPHIHRALKHTASMEDTQRAVTFITNMAAVHALPLPGRNRTNKDERYLLLPSDLTKAFIFKKYEAACTKDHVVPFKRRKFETVWNEILPYIVTARPATDLRFVCQQNNRLIATAANVPDNIKSQRLQKRHNRHNSTLIELMRSECCITNSVRNTVALKLRVLLLQRTTAMIMHNRFISPTNRSRIL